MAFVKVAVRKYGDDGNPYRIELDAECLEAPPEPGERVHGHGRAAGVLQFLGKGKRQQVAAAQRVGKIAVMQDVLHFVFRQFLTCESVK